MASEDNIIGYSYALFANIFNELRRVPKSASQLEQQQQQTPLSPRSPSNDSERSSVKHIVAVAPLAARRWRPSRALDEVYFVFFFTSVNLNLFHFN